MKNILGILLMTVVLTITGCGDTESAGDSKNVEEDKVTYQMITMEEAAEIFAASGDYIILDVRREDEFGEGHIPGAINIPNETISDKEIPLLPDRDKMIYVYC